MMAALHLSNGGNVRWYSDDLLLVKDWNVFAEHCASHGEMLVPEGRRATVLELERQLKAARTGGAVGKSETPR